MASDSLAAFPLPFLLTSGRLGPFLSIWTLHFSRLAIVLLLASLTLGQAVRLPLPGQGGGLLASDIAVLLVLFAAVLHIRPRQSATQQTINYKLLLLFTPFIIWSLFTLAVNASLFDVERSLIAFAYWARLSSHLLLLPALLLLFRNYRIAAFARRGLIIAIVWLIILSAIQLVLLPDLKILASRGWDPHQGRLVATWLDPNFFGGWLVLVIPFVSVGIRRQSWRWHGLLTVVALFALLLTQSRSSVLALILALLLFSPLLVIRFFRRASPTKLMLAANLVSLCLFWALLLTWLWGDRLIGLVSFDPTITLRALALKQAWLLVEQHNWLGVGYNFYQFAAEEAGLISNFSIHSRAGADNSWLTLWATTGLPGLILFLLPWTIAFVMLIRRWFLHNYQLSFAAAIAILTLFIHAQFINSFLYSHLLITLALIVALALNHQQSALNSHSHRA